MGPIRFQQEAKCDACVLRYKDGFVKRDPSKRLPMKCSSESPLQMIDFHANTKLLCFGGVF